VQEIKKPLCGGFIGRLMFLLLWPERSDWGESAVLNIQIYLLLLLLLVTSQAFKTVEREDLLLFLLSRCSRIPIVIFIGGYHQWLRFLFLLMRPL